jgi:GT2 family glycosyltransferase
MNIDCSIIILSYNTKAITEKCLLKVKEASFYYQKKRKKLVEVIVVDNASTDGSVDLIKGKFPWVKLIANKTNIGFAKGNNQGMAKAHGKYFLLLNSDAFIKKDTLVQAVEKLENNHADLIGCKLTYKNGSFQPSGGFTPSPGNTISWMLGFEKFPILNYLLHPVHPNNTEFFKNSRSMGWIMGSFMFMRREVFEKTKGFDESFFMYMEEVEWCKRIADNGFSIKYIPSFSIVHLGRASSNYDIAKPLILEAKGLLYFTKKHYPRYFQLVKFVMKLGFSLRLIVFTVFGKKEKKDAYLKILKEL